MLDKTLETCIIEVSKPKELVPAVRAISIYRDCRKTLPVVRPGATPWGRDKSFGFFVSGIQTKGGERKHMKYRHYPLELAHKDFKEAQRKRYRVTTINWTYATERGQVNKAKVHRNEYSLTLRNLIKFIRETVEVAEDVIDIQPERG